MLGKEYICSSTSYTVLCLCVWTATTGLFYSEENRKTIARTVEDRRRTLEELTGALDESATRSFLKVLIDFNAGRATSEHCVDIARASCVASLHGAYAARQVKCPSGHVMSEAPPSGNWTCDGNTEVQGCAFGRDVLHTTRRWRCGACDFDYCVDCYECRKQALERFHDRLAAAGGAAALEEKSAEGSEGADDAMVNEDGIRTVLSLDRVHARQMRHYCGRAVGSRGYFNGLCRTCDGTCGPSNGCQCIACFRLDNPGAERNRQEPLKLNDTDWRFMDQILSLFLDIERRCALQLELFRKFPMISTPCCGQNHCFLCKITGHHPGRTCEDVQRAAFGQQCQYCPSCNVPTLRTEGCSHIICPCGRNWQWDTSRGNGSDDEGAADPPAPRFGGYGGRGQGRGRGRGGRGRQPGREWAPWGGGRGLAPPVPPPEVTAGRGLFGVPFTPLPNATPLAGAASGAATGAATLPPQQMPRESSNQPHRTGQYGVSNENSGQGAPVMQPGNVLQPGNSFPHYQLRQMHGPPYLPYGMQYYRPIYPVPFMPPPFPVHHAPPSAGPAATFMVPVYFVSFHPHI